MALWSIGGSCNLTIHVEVGVSTVTDSYGLLNKPN